MVPIETSEEDRRLCISASAHYAERLRKVIYDENIIPVENEFLKLDLIRESTHAEELHQRVQEKGIIDHKLVLRFSNRMRLIKL